MASGKLLNWKRTHLWVGIAGLLMGVAACAGSEPPPQDLPATTPVSAQAVGMVNARVVDVLDGATIEVEIEGRIWLVRYLGVDIPIGGGLAGEIGEEASQFNRSLVMGKAVELERGAVDADAAGRLLRYVYVSGQMANIALLINGYATVAQLPASFAYRSEFLAAEGNARSSRKGVWQRAPETAGGETPTAQETEAPAAVFFGTLPPPPSGQGSPQICDHSDSTGPVIKGNVDERTGERLYYLPGSLLYGITVVDEAKGDRWFCTELEAKAAGWKKSKR